MEGIQEDWFNNIDPTPNKMSKSEFMARYTNDYYNKRRKKKMEYNANLGATIESVQRHTGKKAGQRSR